MRMIGKLLSALGAHGPALLVISLVAGAAINPLAHFGYSILPASAFLLTLGSFLTAGLATSEARVRLSRLGLVLAWVGFALPLAGAALLSRLALDPSLHAGVMLSLLAPPVGSAAAIAAMLGLQPRLALLVSLALTVMAPISIPLFANVLGLGIAFGMGQLALRLFGIIGTAALVAYLLIRFRRRFAPLLPDQHAATGIAVLGLVAVGLATSDGVRTQWMTNRLMFEEMLVAAFAINLGLCAIGTVIFSGLGLQTAGTIGLLSGNRNVTLAWAAASFGLPSLAEGYVAACVIPVLALPIIVRLCVRLMSSAARLRPSQTGSVKQPSV
jgi:ACR3 family arsenite transporter